MPKNKYDHEYIGKVMPVPSDRFLRTPLPFQGMPRWLQPITVYSYQLMRIKIRTLCPFYSQTKLVPKRIRFVFLPVDRQVRQPVFPEQHWPKRQHLRFEYKISFNFPQTDSMSQLRETSEALITSLMSAHAELGHLSHRLEQEFQERCRDCDVNPLSVVHRVNKIRRQACVARCGMMRGTAGGLVQTPRAVMQYTKY